MLGGHRWRSLGMSLARMHMAAVPCKAVFCGKVCARTSLKGVEQEACAGLRKHCLPTSMQPDVRQGEPVGSWHTTGLQGQSTCHDALLFLRANVWMNKFAQWPWPLIPHRDAPDVDAAGHAPGSSGNLRDKVVVQPFTGVERRPRLVSRASLRELSSPPHHRRRAASQGRRQA